MISTCSIKLENTPPALATTRLNESRIGQQLSHVSGDSCILVQLLSGSKERRSDLGLRTNDKSIILWYDRFEFIWAQTILFVHLKGSLEKFEAVWGYFLRDEHLLGRSTHGFCCCLLLKLGADQGNN